MLFANARLVLENHTVKASLRTEGPRIEAYGEHLSALPGEEVVDCKGLYLAPGFIDIHSHGGGGHDIMDGDAEDIVLAAKAHLRHGTTTYYPTAMTNTDEATIHTFECFREARNYGDAIPHLEGIHMEGPYFSPAQAGAQDPSFIKIPKQEHYRLFLEKGGDVIKRISFAPELPGAIEMADALRDTGIVLAAGHTNATYQEISRAFDHGVTHLTHFYSGMSTIHREGGFRILGAVEAGYLIDGLTIELIADGMHLPPELLKMILKLKAHDHISLCTDSMRGADMPEGPTILGPKVGGVKCFVEGGIAKMPNHQAFAGSVATTDRLVRVMHQKAGLTIAEAVAMMTINPARVMHIDGKTGSIAVGKQADLVLFDENIQVNEVYVSGKRV